MTKTTLSSVTNLYNNPVSGANTINDNNAKIVAAIENTLSRDGTSPNQMLADFDVNHNDIINAGSIFADRLYVDGNNVQEAAQWYVGAGAPSDSLGAVKDLYLDNTNGNVYGPKTQAGWGSPTENITGPQGTQGPTGATGSQGPAGTAATINVGTVTTGSPGTNAVVTNVGTSNAAVFNFTIPRGDVGPAGPGTGDMLKSVYDPQNKSTDAFARANHTGTQSVSTITGLATVATSGAYSDLSGKPTLGTAASQNTGTSGANVPFLNGTNTWSGVQIFPEARISAAAGAYRPIKFQTSGNDRWWVAAGNGAESGSNAGSNFVINSYDDIGTYLSTPLSITRSTGVVSLSQPLPVGSGGTGGTTQATARSGIGAAASGANSDITSLSGLSTALSVAQGGTGVTTSTGSGSNVLSNSPTLTTPNIGAATATSVNKVTITAPATSATLTLANGTTLTTTSSTSIGQGQYQGTATNDNASSGNIGEYILSEIAAGSAVALTSLTPANVTSISLTAGDWDVWGTVAYSYGGATTVTDARQAIVTTSATLPTLPAGGGYTILGMTSSQAPVLALSAGMTRLSLSATTTVYLVARATFAVSTMSAYGGIYARRVR